jgi:cation diffusion facilitator CzcD-associated flavoprotein CzcO
VATEVTPSERAASDDAVHSPAIIVGAGPAGLAVAACLKRAGIPCILLEQSKEVGAAWHRHYDRLHLHSDKAHSALPFLDYPKDYPRYPSRLQVIAYLQAYARQFQLEPRLGQRVVAARPVNGHWEVETQDARYKTPNLIVATGYNRTPKLPTWPGQASFRGTLLHSSQYRSGAPFRNQAVLVVGLGNSGGEIAIDLCEHGARPSLAVRGPVNVIPRELLGIPIVTIAGLEHKLPERWVEAMNRLILRVVMGDLTRYGLRQLPHGPAVQIRRSARIPLIDVGTLDLIKHGRITVCPGVESFTETGVVFTDGNRAQFDAVILATGYRPRVDEFLRTSEAAHDENGTPWSSGREAEIPGLYFCGYFVSPIGMLRDIAREARQIAGAILRKEALE